MNTKEKILSEALKLFAQKGYSDVYVKDIAMMVNIKAPSLYKHFKNKQEIFDNCIKTFYEKMNKKRNTLLLPKNSVDNEIYLHKSRTDIIHIAQELFEFYLLDEIASNFRKMLLIDRYKDHNINRLYEQIFIDDPISYQIEVFSLLLSSNKVKFGNATDMANAFYSQIYFLLQKYDEKKEKLEDAKKEIEIFINVFCNIWGIKE
ncbi:transcriptional regulator, TetR family [Gemella bergeri ATCC 700627]|uniref:Transcriptional regulator, TetR family n=1 Tax=Gemella bergeri ATCC 700627 TaxID=1321820 RepID=U2QVC4_9BACL|nr:TetR/AcrR family transcriptional regulator [Gemella bergeri]ERK60169.1 transcriptional regulator, TetR family [Gemella bergeri ATCC 700627]